MEIKIFKNVLRKQLQLLNILLVLSEERTFRVNALTDKLQDNDIMCNTFTIGLTLLTYSHIDHVFSCNLPKYMKGYVWRSIKYMSTVMRNIIQL